MTLLIFQDKNDVKVGRELKMPAFILLILVYIIAIGCVFIMKKIQPESVFVYAVWVVFVCVLLTLIVIFHG